MLTTIIGTLGAAIVLLGFIMIETKKWNDETFYYDLANFVGSLLLVIYAIILRSYPFLILNTIWGLVALKDVISRLRTKNN